MNNEYTKTWITDRAWISGLMGAITVILCAYWYNRTGILFKGFSFHGVQFTTNKTDSLLAALLIISLSMIILEVVRLYLWDKNNFITVNPLVKENTGQFITSVITNYVLNMLILWLVLQFYHTAGEYGFNHDAPYYQGWFRILELIFKGYLWLGVPYIFVTRALKHNELADDKDLAILLESFVLSLLTPRSSRKNFNSNIKKAARSFLVKLFFAPLMTVFFLDQFPHLVSNIGYLLDSLPSLIKTGRYTHSSLNKDLFNIGIALIFSIDVALAWCGYMFSTRWLDNQTTSAEPSILGWIVCIICYPPFQMFLGLYYSSPVDREILNIQNQWLASFFIVMMLLSYMVYMCSTLWFGTRFSNLTNRGIIRKGPFAFVRHPAYASKNFAWWCVMLPTILYNLNHTGVKVAVLQIVGLCVMTFIYYQRAITEEKHLKQDSNYRDYCNQVKYKFLPGIL